MNNQDGGVVMGGWVAVVTGEQGGGHAGRGRKSWAGVGVRAGWPSSGKLHTARSGSGLSPKRPEGERKPPERGRGLQPLCIAES